ncbi:PF04325 family protein [Bordetella bronchiseptica SBL-F6116]|nr:PF04325 family protein [Bordetella bronchiseptica MO211]KDC29731.1 PF04325 family protein [Bordetella bronchiseptica F4563]KDD19431.1 PF04325 family protein [Bordetella bronchiseptica MBORD707]KDD96302.1 PF04325 family protein [Bordetella bronchiseptica SBL-F6116]
MVQPLDPEHSASTDRRRDARPLRHDRQSARRMERAAIAILGSYQEPGNLEPPHRPPGGRGIFIKEVPMFPEYRDLISRLKNDDPHFSRLYDKHNNLDQHIQDIEAGRATGTSLDIEKLKKEKLHLKDQIYAILKNGA